jgi:hypothetical protein
MKRTGSKYLRIAGTPNVRRQDGPREELLCADCENRFARDERFFAKRIFYPFLVNPSQAIPYNAFLIRFLLSVTWRILVSKIYGKRPTKTFEKELSEAQEEWRLFLLGPGDLQKYDRVHLFITDILADPIQPVRRLNQYLARGVDGSIAASKRDCAVYAKFARFVVWAEITQFDQELWQNTRIVNGTGVLSTPQSIRDGRVGDFILDRAKGGAELYLRSISKRQQDIISKKFLEEAANLRGGDFWRALEADMEAHVDPHQWKGRRIGRNDMCPCGSAKKYKHCHGR